MMGKLVLNEKQRVQVEKNLRLIGFALKRIDVKCIGGWDDAYQIGSIGLMKAAVHYVNLREAASTKSESLMQIPKDAVVDYTGEQDGDFLKVSYEGKTGYVHDKYLEKVEETEPVMMEVVNCKNCVTLRKEPSKKAAALADVPLRAKVEFIRDEGNGFNNVRYNGDSGYILASYLK